MSNTTCHHENTVAADDNNNDDRDDDNRNDDNLTDDNHGRRRRWDRSIMEGERITSWALMWESSAKIQDLRGESMNLKKTKVLFLVYCQNLDKSEVLFLVLCQKSSARSRGRWGVHFLFL